MKKAGDSTGAIIYLFWKMILYPENLERLMPFSCENQDNIWALRLEAGENKQSKAHSACPKNPLQHATTLQTLLLDSETLSLLPCLVFGQEELSPESGVILC